MSALLESLQPSFVADPVPSQAFEVHAFDAPFGAEVVGLDLARPLNAADFQALHRAGQGRGRQAAGAAGAAEVKGMGQLGEDPDGAYVHALPQMFIGCGGPTGRAGCCFCCNEELQRIHFSQQKNRVW